MNNALAMATAANNAIHQTPMDPAVQTALNFLFNTGDASLVPDYGNRKSASQCFEYLSLQGNADDKLFCRRLWWNGYYPPDDRSYYQCCFRIL